jgi:hypothetical protein
MPILGTLATLIDIPSAESAAMNLADISAREDRLVKLCQGLQEEERLLRFRCQPLLLQEREEYLGAIGRAVFALGEARGALLRARLRLHSEG